MNAQGVGDAAWVGGGTLVGGTAVGVSTICGVGEAGGSVVAGAEVAVGTGAVSVGSGDEVTDAVGAGCVRVAGAVARMLAVGACGLAVGVGAAAGAGRHAARKAKLHTNRKTHRRAATMLASIRSRTGLNPACQVADGRLELHAGVFGTLSSQRTEVPGTPAYRRR